MHRIAPETNTRPFGLRLRTLGMLLHLVVFATSTIAEDARPNIVIVLADDMGYSDVGCFGSEIQTPNIDRLAASGLLMTQFYNAGKCCPTRASLLTGLYPHQAGIGWMVSADLGQPGYRGDLSSHCVTIAEVLGTHGYRCYLSGKWHVTPWDYKKNDGPKHNWPLERGFHHCFSTINGSGNYFNFGSLVRDRERIGPGDHHYYTDAISDEAVRYIRTHVQDSNSPFFLYVAYTAPHFPLHAKKKDIEKYVGKYRAGWSVVRSRRHSRMKELGIVPTHWQASPIDAASWDRLSDQQQRLWDRRMAVYAAQVDCMDQGIGRIMAALDETATADNTLVIFLSDNGGCAEIKSRSDQTIDALGTRKSYESYRREWANVSNTPLRLYKRYAHEGGISTPFVARWPKGIRETGRKIHAPAHVVDLMATCVDVAGAAYPSHRAGKMVPAAQGVSLKPAWEGEKLERSQPLFWEYEGNRAIRVDQWKLVARGLLENWELYDLEKDRCETEDVASLYPDLVSTLSTRWHEWAEKSNVLPLDGRTKEERLASAIDGN